MSSDKRTALLSAALRLIARSGLHATPTAAVAREAGVAAGTLYLYFPSKDALINALYLELVSDQLHAAGADAPEPSVATPPAESLWTSWYGLARWHLDHPEASSVIHQCRASGILTAETREAEARQREGGLVRFRDAIALGHLRDLSSTAFWALYAGPIFTLVESIAFDAGEVDEEALRAVFAGVSRAVLPPG